MGRLRHDPLRPLWVDLQMLEKTLVVDDPAMTGSAVGYIGAVDGGDWDLNGTAVRDHDGVLAILRAPVADGRERRPDASSGGSFARNGRQSKSQSGAGQQSQDQEQSGKDHRKPNLYPGPFPPLPELPQRKKGYQYRKKN
jgi:hypothetical protein